MKINVYLGCMIHIVMYLEVSWFSIISRVLDWILICGIINNKGRDIVNIIEYNDKYLEDVRDLLVELEEYILTIDKDD